MAARNKRNFVLKRENPTNVLIEEKDVLDILRKYDVNVPVNNLEHYRKAFIHRSYLKTNESAVDTTTTEVPLQTQCNERLELLGDCILSSVVGTYLFIRFENEQEGFLTQNKTKIVRGTTLGKLGKRMGFGKWVIISLHVEGEGGRNNKRILEDLFECFIGAIYLDNGGEPVESEWFTAVQQLNSAQDQLIEFEKSLDLSVAQSAETMKRYMELSQKHRHLANKVISTRSNGYLVCQKFIMNVLEREIDLVKLVKHNDNYKDQLQHYFQEHFMGIFPKWEDLKIEGPTNDRWHTVGVRDDRGMIIGTGLARKKAHAQQKASKNALKYLGIDVGSDSDDDDDYEPFMKQETTSDTEKEE